MDGDINLHCVPLSRLSDESRKLLSSLLNTKKVLKTVCPDRISRYRDWRGLASLVNISTQVETSIKEYPDKIEKVFEIWTQNDSGATVGQLMHYLQLLDRFDVHSDLLELARNNKLIAPAPCEELARVDSPEDDLITFQDVRHNAPQLYHAYVLFAPQDRDFVDAMLKRLRDEGLKLCTEDDLLPGFSTRIEPVVRLISERCRRIVLVYSPDFFRSPAVKFITHIAQAHGVETNIRNLIPIMYRACTLPRVLSHYHNLVYMRRGAAAGQADDDLFWRKLTTTLDQGGVPRLKNGSVSSESSGVVIREMAPNGVSPDRHSRRSSFSTDRYTPEKREQLALPDIPKDSVSESNICLPSVPTEPLPPYKVTDSKSLVDIREEGKKKMNRVERFFSHVRSIPSRIGKKKKVIMVEN